MNPHFDPESASSTKTPPPEETLRLLAELPPPPHLEDRVHRRLAAARLEQESAPRGFWSLWHPARRLQFAAAGALAIAVAVSTWSVYRQPAVPGVSQTAKQPVTAQKPAAADAPSGFQTSGAERRPSSLTPIKVPPAPKRKKPSAAKTGAKPSAVPASSLPNP